MNEKERIAEKLAEERQRKKDIDKRMEVQNKLLANISTSLKQFDWMCQIINDDTAKVPFKKDRVVLPSGGMLYREKCPNPGEYDARKINDSLFVKVQKLTSIAAQISKDFAMTHETESLVAYGSLAAKNMRFIPFAEVLTDECKRLDGLKCLMVGFYVFL